MKNLIYHAKTLLVQFEKCRTAKKAQNVIFDFSYICLETVDCSLRENWWRDCWETKEMIVHLSLTLKFDWQNVLPRTVNLCGNPWIFRNLEFPQIIEHQRCNFFHKKITNCNYRCTVFTSPIASETVERFFMILKLLCLLVDLRSFPRSHAKVYIRTAQDYLVVMKKSPTWTIWPSFRKQLRKLSIL